MKALVLDATFFPVQIIDWKKAMVLFFTQRAEVVDFHEDIEIRSTNDSFRLPKVLRLFEKVNNLGQVKFSRSNVFYRDKFLCQYCTKKFEASELTLDHVMPKSRGGKTSWENIVACCRKCNNSKADRTPREAGLKLLHRPRQPNWSPMLAFKLSKAERKIFASWFFK
ncbi:MAG: HNH endonuclease [Bacteriovoracaceae bacterium]|nr:HNH endonuclease [Bacteriovoracaceae bacterium]